MSLCCSYALQTSYTKWWNHTWPHTCRRIFHYSFIIFDEMRVTLQNLNIGLCLSFGQIHLKCYVCHGPLVQKALFSVLLWLCTDLNRRDGFILLFFQYCMSEMLNCINSFLSLVRCCAYILIVRFPLLQLHRHYTIPNDGWI